MRRDVDKNSYVLGYHPFKLGKYRAANQSAALIKGAQNCSTQVARLEKKWSARQTLLFVCGVSGLLWVGILWIYARYF
jgi:hypothetical protein